MGMDVTAWVSILHGFIIDNGVLVVGSQLKEKHFIEFNFGVGGVDNQQKVLCVC